MAIPPTIPTSFVPKQPISNAPKHRVSGANPFLALAYLITGITVVAGFGVFGYQLYLENVAKQKEAQVTTAQNAIDEATVTEFIRLRDRFTEAGSILDNHIILSQFFDVLEHLTLTGVRFNSLAVSVAEDRTATISLAGTAKSFNTLAAQSAEIATDKRIKRAIFSGISGSPKDNSVSFGLSAELDPSLVRQDASGASLTQPPQTQTPAPSAPVGTSTATTTP